MPKMRHEFKGKGVGEPFRLSEKPFRLSEDMVAKPLYNNDGVVVALYVIDEDIDDGMVFVGNEMQELFDLLDQCLRAHILD